MNKTQFREQLENIINCNSMESGSDTPNFILAEFLKDCLEAFDKAVTRRTKWYKPISIDEFDTSSPPCE